MLNAVKHLNWDSSPSAQNDTRESRFKTSGTSLRSTG